MCTRGFIRSRWTVTVQSDLFDVHKTWAQFSQVDYQIHDVMEGWS